MSETDVGASITAQNGVLYDADGNRIPSVECGKDPDHWTTGGETMTGAQASSLQTLCEEAGAEFDPSRN
jgi:Protein of unknown function (DUF3072)